MRHVLLLSCISCAMLLPLRNCIFATEGTGEEIEVQLPRRISPSKEGGVLCASREEKLRVVFGDGFEDWAFERKDDKWLIRQSRIGNQPELYLSFQTKEPADPKADLVRLVEQCDETCLWNLEFEFVDSRNSGERSCYASPTSGAFRGWFMAAGEPIEKRDGFVLSRAVTLQKDKSPLALLRLWVDGP